MCSIDIVINNQLWLLVSQKSFHNALTCLQFQITLHYMKSIKLRTTRILYQWLIVLSAIVLMMVALFVWRVWPASDTQMLQSTAIVECQSWYEVQTDGMVVMCFSDVGPDSVLHNPSLKWDPSKQTTFTTGVWLNRHSWIPSCNGRLVTTGMSNKLMDKMNGKLLMVHENDFNQRRVHQITRQLKELDYYLHVHQVQDEGYNKVADYTVKQRQKLAFCQSLGKVLDTICQAKNIRIVHRSTYVAHVKYNINDTMHIACRVINTRDIAETGKNKLLLLLQVHDKKTPKDVSPQSMMPWRSATDGEALAVGYGGLGVVEFASPSATPSILPVTLQNSIHSLSPVLGSDGTPIYSQRGRFIGITLGKEVVSRKILADLFKKEDKK